MARPIPVALAWLSREERALTLVLCGLAGRQAPALCDYLPEARAARVRTALAALLALPAADRQAVLAADAARLAAPLRADAAAVAPERRALLEMLTPRGRPVHRSALGVVQSLLAGALPPSPWEDEIAAAPPAVQALLRASPERLGAIADALGPSRLRSVLAGAPPTLSAWLRKRLSPAREAEVDRAPPSDPAESLLALAQHTRTEVTS